MSRVHRTAQPSSGADGIGSWTLHRGRPHVGLHGLVARQVRWQATHVGAAVTRELPSGEVQLILAPAEPVDVRDPGTPLRTGRRLHALVAGLHEGHAVTADPADSVGVQFGLTAPGAAELLGVAPRDLRDQVVDLRDLFGRDADELLDRVRDAMDPWQQIGAVASLLLARRPRRPRVVPEVGAEMTWTTGMVMFGSGGDARPQGSAMTGISLLVDDIDAHHRRAVAAGADADPIRDTEYGSREYAVRDLEGNSWHVGTYDPWSA